MSKLFTWSKLYLHGVNFFIYQQMYDESVSRCSTHSVSPLSFNDEYENIREILINIFEDIKHNNYTYKCNSMMSPFYDY